jgi:hypothetical protein
MPDKTVTMKVTVSISGEDDRVIEIGYPIDLRDVPHASATVHSRVRELLDIALTTSKGA